MAQDIEGRIWVGKDYDGIDVLEKETGKVTSLVAHDDNGRSLPHNTIYDLYADRDGIMWVALIRKEYLIIVKVSLSSICMNGEI